MTTAAAYAKALKEKVQEDPAKASAYIANLKKTLATRGYTRLLPSIVHEYEKLELAESRSKARANTTPETERTRMLLELYRTLVSTS